MCYSPLNPLYVILCSVITVSTGGDGVDLVDGPLLSHDNLPQTSYKFQLCVHHVRSYVAVYMIVLLPTLL